MKEKIKYLIVIIILLSLISCGKRNKLNKENLNYIPYKENETLVFKSDRDDLDTIFLTGLRRFNGCNDPLAFFPDDCEGYTLTCTKSDPNYDRYLEEKGLVEIVAVSGNRTLISFDITMKRSWFYNMESFTLEQFDSIPNNELKIKNKIYSDVKVFEADGSYEQRDNYVERFYWSVSGGFLGLDRRDEKWRLIKKVE
jgi:hypothetical protein